MSGVVFTPDCSFTDHVKHIALLAFGPLSFIGRISTHFKNPGTLRILYNVLILPNLKYCSLILSPSHCTYLDSIERIQYKFLRIVTCKLGNPIPLNCNYYGPILSKLRFLALEQRRAFIRNVISL